jgi:hypothetical protein
MKCDAGTQHIQQMTLLRRVTAFFFCLQLTVSTQQIPSLERTSSSVFGKCLALCTAQNVIAVFNRAHVWPLLSPIPHPDVSFFKIDCNIIVASTP